MTNLWYLFVAYMVVWTGLWLYTLRLGNKGRLISKRLDQIESIVSRETRGSN